MTDEQDSDSTKNSEKQSAINPENDPPSEEPTEKADDKSEENTDDKSEENADDESQGNTDNIEEDANAIESQDEEVNDEILIIERIDEANDEAEVDTDETIPDKDEIKSHTSESDETKEETESNGQNERESEFAAANDCSNQSEENDEPIENDNPSSENGSCNLQEQEDNEVFEEKSELGFINERLIKAEAIRSYSRSSILKPSSTRQLFVVPHRSLHRTKKTTFHIAKHLVLTLLITTVAFGFAIGGGFLFCHLENQRDVIYNAKVDKWKNDTAILLATELRQISPYEDVWAKKVYQYLEIFEKDLLKASYIGYRRPEDPDRGQRWTFKSSLFFSVSLMTTTGYGSMTPRSEWGRIAVMTFSTLGIPIALAWLVAMGTTMGVLWNWIFESFCCHPCHATPSTKVHPKTTSRPPTVLSNGIPPTNGVKQMGQSGTPLKMRSSPTRIRDATRADRGVAIVLAITLLIVYFIFGSAAVAITEDWMISESFYYNFIMLVTIGPGCHELEAEMAEAVIRQSSVYLAYLLIGYCLIFMILYLMYRFFCSGENNAKHHRDDFSSSLINHPEKLYGT